MPRRRALGLTRLLCDGLFFFFSFGCGPLGKAAVVVVLRLRRMRRSVTAQDLANVCEKF